MGRTQLTSLLEPRGNQEDADRLRTPESETEAAPEPPAAASQVAPARTRTASSPRPRRAPKPRPAKQPAGTEALPPYLRFERKEARLRTDQLTELTLRARQLNKTKNPDADRITDNTLIRVAVDLLLSRADTLAGGDEAELRKSLGLTSVD